MGTQPIFVKNARIVNEGKIFKGHLLINNGRIEAIFESGNELPGFEDMRHINLEGLYLLPGVIDDQVHFREPGLTHKGDIYTESRAAVAGGITSFMEMPNTVPQTTSQEMLEKKFLLGSQKSLANYSFYIGATNQNHDQLRATDPQNVCGIKIFMGSSTGNMLVDNPESLSKIFREAKIPVAVHCEDEQTINDNLQEAIKRFGDDIPFEQHPVIRSHQACYLSSSLAISLAKRFGTRLHILHLSTAKETGLLDNDIALKDKLITSEVCVHHLWFTDEGYKQKGNLIKWNPAIKTAADRDALQQALKTGHIDVVATDHAPHTAEEKNNKYLQCPSGGPMVQHSLAIMLEMVHKGIYTLEEVVKYMSHNPAIIFNIKNRGFIRQGFAADLVAVNLDKPNTVQANKLLYKCGWSPVEGTTLRSAIEYTFVNGNVVYEKGTVNETTRGMALEFSR